MTEAEWLAHTDSVQLLDHLNRPQGDRKFFLFALACCRNIWPLLPQPEMRKGVEVAERFAKGNATEEELYAANLHLEGAMYGGVEYFADRPELKLPEEISGWMANLWAIPTDQLAAIACCGGEDFPTDLMGLLKDAGYFADHVLVMNSCVPHSPTIRWHRRFLNLHLLRDIYGNPFRPVTMNPNLFTTTVRQLAALIFEERAFERLPILADALEEAGCTNDEILAHCRGAGPHVRGCWVVDLLLDKE